MEGVNDNVELAFPIGQLSTSRCRMIPQVMANNTHLSVIKLIRQSFSKKCPADAQQM